MLDPGSVMLEYSACRNGRWAFTLRETGATHQGCNVGRLSVSMNRVGHQPYGSGLEPHVELAARVVGEEERLLDR